jgi:hypothetical protein
MASQVELLAYQPTAGQSAWDPIAWHYKGVSNVHLRQLLWTIGNAVSEW